MSKTGKVIIFSVILIALFVIASHSSLRADDNNRGSASTNIGIRANSNNINATFSEGSGASTSSHNNEQEVEVKDNGHVRNVTVHEGEDAEQIREALQHKNKIDISSNEVPDNCDKTGAVIRCDIGGQMQIDVQVSTESMDLSNATQQTLNSLESNLQNGTNEIKIQIEAEAENEHSPQVEIEGGITSGQKTILDTLVKEIVADVQAAGSNAHANIEIRSKFVEERAMVVIAGNSGNVIIQVKGVNATTQVQIYRSNGSVYALLPDNTTVLISYFPDDVQEKILQTLNNTETEGNESINLTKDGNYTADVDKHARFLGIFKVNEHMTFVVNSETGDVLEQHAPWWGFLAADIKASSNNATNTAQTNTTTNNTTAVNSQH